jgi:hypothetical protein
MLLWPKPPNITRVIKYRRTRWAGHVAFMGEMRNVYKILVGKPERMKPFDKDKEGWIILK